MSTKLSLPVLPLDDTVVLPTMVVPLDISSSEARASIEAAQMSAEAPGSNENGPQVLLVPRLGGKYAPVGTLAAVEQVGRLPSGEHAAVVRGLSRVRIGTGTTGPGAALWVEGTVEEEPPGGPRAQELAREYRGLAATILQKRGRGSWWTSFSGLPTRPRWPTAPGTPATSAWSSATSCWRPFTEQRLEKLVGWSRDHIAELDVAETIQNDVREGMEKQQREFLLRQQLAAIRKELAESRTASRARRTPRKRTTGPGSRPPTCRREGGGGAQGGRQAGAHLRPVAGGRMDPHLAGHGAGDPVEHPDRRRL